MGKSSHKIEVRNTDTRAIVMIHHPEKGRISGSSGYWVFHCDGHPPIPISNRDKKRIDEAREGR